MLTERNFAIPISCKGHWWARGYFQDPRVFTSERSRIRDQLRQHLEQRVDSDAAQVTADYAAVHVRRGDYVAVARNAQRLGICSPDYFTAAVNDLTQSLPVKVVSDDPEWCRTTLKPRLGRDVEIVNSGSDLADLLILMRSSEIVLSNSTFSWWGAFCSEARLIVAPSKWFDAEDAGGHHLPTLAHILRDKSTGSLAVTAG
ncbi:alpha-1,2-fucosyltransferase [Mycolicibacterium vanbaalenii]|nr:alpha-1,2-fucosyltransferase [Mycolicibacterium vanbaalenii]